MRWTEEAYRLMRRAVLMGGRAPGRWQEEVSQSVAHLSELQRSGSWIGSWVAEASIQLPDGPFWGSTLAELVGQGSRWMNYPGMAPSQFPGRGAESRREFPALSRTEEHPSPSAQPTAERGRERLSGFNARDREQLPGAEGPRWSRSVRTPPRPAWQHEMLSPAGGTMDYSHLSELQRSGSWIGPWEAESRREFPALSRTDVYPSPPAQPTAERGRERLSGFNARDREQLPGAEGPRWSRSVRTPPRPAWQHEMLSPAGGTMGSSPISDSMTLPQAHPACERVQALLQMERAASRALLSRLAIDASLEDEQRLQQPRWIKEVSGQKNAIPPGPAGDADARFIWLSGLARQAWHSLRLEIDKTVDGGPASPRPGLAGQWSLPLEGPRASAQTLAALAGRSEGEEASSDRGGKAESRSQANLSGNAGGWSSAGAPARESISPSVLSRQPEAGSQLKEGGPLAYASLREQRPALRFGVAGSTDHIDPAPEASAGIAPPQAAGTLPPLLLAQAEGSPLRFAAGAAQQGAKQALGAEDDLGILAEKIKRILDEEARRHGIDV